MYIFDVLLVYFFFRVSFFLSGIRRKEHLLSVLRTKGHLRRIAGLGARRSLLELSEDARAIHCELVSIGRQI